MHFATINSVDSTRKSHYMHVSNICNTCTATLIDASQVKYTSRHKKIKEQWALVIAGRDDRELRRREELESQIP